MAKDVQLDSTTQDELKSAVTRALNTPTGAAPLLGLPNIDLGGKVKEAVGVLDTLIEGLTKLQEYKWIIPDQYEASLDKLLAALVKVKGWVA